MSGYSHGIFGSEVETSLLAPVTVDSGLTVAFGTAPIHLAKNPAKANTPVLCYQLREYVEQFGYTGDFDKYTLDEVAQTQFVLYKMAPVVFVNVFDPEKHFQEFEKVVENVSESTVNLGENVISDSVKVTSSGFETVTLTGDVDYTAEYDSDSKVTTIDIVIDAKLPSDTVTISYDVDSDTLTTTANISDLPVELPEGAKNISVTAEEEITNVLTADLDYMATLNDNSEMIFAILDSQNVFDDKVKISYHTADPSLVTEDDIIGGIDIITDKATGLEVIVLVVDIDKRNDIYKK